MRAGLHACRPLSKRERNLPTPNQTSISNKLLTLLPEADYGRAAPHLTHVALPQGTVLSKAGDKIEYVYFLTLGIGSVVAVTPEGHRAEAGLFGWDGYIPSSAASGTEFSPHDIHIQADAEAYRMDYGVFHTLMDERNFAKVMVRSIEAFSIQLTYTAISNAIHEINERLARWLLMCHDRLPGDDIRLTHDYLAVMLAVRRPSVTTALHVLEGNGFIRSNRGVITIRNRPAMEEFAHDAYGKPEAEYRRLMKDLFARNS